MIRIQVQRQPIDCSALQESLWLDRPRVGAMVSFIGLMRDFNEGQQISAMTLEHYPGMTERALGAIADQAMARWDLEGIAIVHRVGPLAPQDVIVFVGVASTHRTEAFRACEFLIDYLKTRAPFWKKETTATGECWVDARDLDQSAADRWADPDR